MKYLLIILLVTGYIWLNTPWLKGQQRVCAANPTIVRSVCMNMSKTEAQDYPVFSAVTIIYDRNGNPIGFHK